MGTITQADCEHQMGGLRDEYEIRIADHHDLFWNQELDDDSQRQRWKIYKKCTQRKTPTERSRASMADTESFYEDRFHDYQEATPPARNWIKWVDELADHLPGKPSARRGTT